MPDKDVKTILDRIRYQYAKIITKSALGPDAKKRVRFYQADHNGGELNVFDLDACIVV